MKHLFRCALAATLVVLPLETNVVEAADAYPSHTIRIIVNTGPGGLVDIAARLIAKQMSEELKQSVIVENRAGGDGMVGINAVKIASPDGYTLLASAGTMAYEQVVKRDAGYDLRKDFTGIGFIGKAPVLLDVSPTQGFNSLNDFVTKARDNPGKLSYASAGIGTGTHFGAALLLQREKLDLSHIPYKGNGPAMPDVVSGRVTMILDAYASSQPYLAGGKLKALGVTSLKRLAAAPDIPTIAEQGVPDFSFYTWMGLVAPAGTPAAAIARLSAALQKAVADPTIKARFDSQGIETSNMAPEEFNRFLASEIDNTAKLMTQLHIEQQ